MILARTISQRQRREKELEQITQHFIVMNLHNVITETITIQQTLFTTFTDQKCIISNSFKKRQHFAPGP